MIKGAKSLNDIAFIVKAWNLESITTIKESYSVCKKCSIFYNLENDMVQCIRYFNGVIDGVDLLEGFTMDELRHLLSKTSVAWSICCGRCL